MSTGLHRFEILIRDKEVGDFQRLLLGVKGLVKVDGKPMVNATVGANGQVKATLTGTNLCSLFADHVFRNKIKELTPAQIDAFCASIGRTAKHSRYYAIQCGINGGWLKKTGKSHATKYLVVQPKPNKKRS